MGRLSIQRGLSCTPSYTTLRIKLYFLNNYYFPSNYVPMELHEDNILHYDLWHANYFPKMQYCF